MSIRVMASVWDSKIDNQTDLLVLLALADFANDQGISWPSLEGLAQKSRSSVRNVQRILKRLELAGVLKVQRMGGGAPGSTNFYHINLKGETGDSLTPVGVTRRGGGVTNEGGRGVTKGGGGVTELGQRSVSRSVIGTDPSVQPSIPGELSLDGNEVPKSLKKTPEETIYEAYPLKVGKVAALAKIRAALTQIDYQKLLDLTLRYAAAVRQFGDPKYTPHPSTWFHQERFFDDPSTWVRSNGSTLKANTAQEIAKSWGVEC
jgi:hypothetical protein